MLILAAILLLIGVFQYLYMQQFLYKNKAETIKNQIVASPLEIWAQGIFIGGGPGRGMPGSGGRDLGGGAGGGGTGHDSSGSGNGTGTSPGTTGGTSGGTTGAGNGAGGNNAGGGFGVRDDGAARSTTFFFPDASLAFYNTNGEYSLVAEDTAVGKPPLYAQSELVALLQQSNPTPFYETITNENGDEQLVVLVPLRDRGNRLVGVAELSTLTNPLRQVLLHQLLTFLSLAAGAVVVGLLTYLPVLRRTLVPLSNMVDTVEKIDAGRLDERFPVDQGQLEIDRLAASFNGMLKRLESSFEAEKEGKERMRRFIADASHELRTPLTSIHGFIEILMRGAANNPEQLQKALASMHGESSRMNKLVNDLLTLAKIDRGPDLHLEDVQLEQLVLSMEPHLRMLAGKRTVTIVLDDDVPKVLIDPDQMKQVLLNLFLNAVQHTDAESGAIEVSVKRSPDAVTFAIRDNGPGIPAEHQPKLFDRFYRVDTSRARKLGGSGLGLAITKSIVDSHGAEIEVESEAGRGTEFRVVLKPIAR
jgi:two-component system OmpR family sensor kinase